jgi:hypothetical protein
LHVGKVSGTLDGMESRVSALETHMVYVRKDLDEIKASLRVLPTLATKADITYWTIQWTALLVAVFAVLVSSIIGGLGWLETRAAGVSPPAVASTVPAVGYIPMPPPVAISPSAPATRGTSDWRPSP